MYTEKSLLKEVYNDPLLHDAWEILLNPLDRFCAGVIMKDEPEATADRIFRHMWVVNKYLTAAKKGEKFWYQLYSPDEIKENENKKYVTAEPFLIGKKAPAAFVLAGGAYQDVANNNEGYPFAKKLNENGYNAIVIRYSVAENARFPAPMEDLARAIEFGYQKAEEFGLDMSRFSIWGSSAAGHLCGYFAAKYTDFEKEYPLRPSAVVLTYPVVTMGENTHDLSRDNLLGKDASDEEKAAKSVQNLITPDYPPTFIWHCVGDTTVPIVNSDMLDEAFYEMGVPYVYLRFEDGQHGLGIATNTVAEGWFEQAVSFVDYYCKQ